MVFWLAAAALTVLVLLLMLLPLLRKGGAEDVATADYDLTVYKNQLKEIARERERGVLNDAEAEAAEAEISRRILAADSARKKAKAGKHLGRPIALAVIVAVLLPLGATAVYMQLGQPGLPNRPFAEREQERQMAQQGMPAMEDAIGKLQARLEENPEDVQGWALLGRSYMTLQQFGKAAGAYARAVELDPSAGLQSAYGEALVYAADGMVTEPAYAVFQTAVKMAQDDPRARFYLARYEYQAGNRQKAMDMLIDLAQSAPVDAVWLPNVRAAAQSIADELEIDIADRLPEAPAPVAEAPRAAPMLSEDQIAAMQDMAPEDRQAMIKSMVEGLAERLKDEPDNLQGWARLARAYVVLKREDEALASFDHILERQPNDVDILLAKARAIRTFAGNVPTAESAALMERVTKLDPKNMEALWFTAMARLRAGDREAAQDLFQRAMAGLDPNSQEYAQLSEQVENLLAQ